MEGSEPVKSALQAITETQASLDRARRDRVIAREMLRQLDDVMLGEKAAETPMHPDAGIGNGHRAGGVTVITAAEGHELLSLGHALVDPELHRHLHGDLDRDRARLRKEHAAEIAGDERRKPPCERYRQCR